MDLLQRLLWPALALTVWGIALAVVPVNRIRRMLSYGFVGGFILAVLIQLVGSVHLNLWRLNHMAEAVAGISLFFSAVWWGESILFGRVLELKRWHPAISILVFAFLSAGVSFGLRLLGYLDFFGNWSYFDIFMVGMFAHIMLYFLHQLMAAGPQRNRIS